MGKTNMGNMVGLGCKNYINVNFMFILFLYIIAWRIYQDTEKVNKVTSFIALVGAVNLPIIKYSVDWWSTLHQPASVSVFEKTSISYYVDPFSINDCGICTIFTSDFFDEI